MKKILLPIFLLLASPALAVNIPNEQKQKLGAKIGTAIQKQDLESAATLVQELFDLQETYILKKDQNWIQSKLEKLQSINRLEIQVEKDPLQFPLEEDEKEIIEEKKPSNGLLSFLGFGSIQSKEKL